MIFGEFNSRFHWFYWGKWKKLVKINLIYWQNGFKNVNFKFISLLLKEQAKLDASKQPTSPDECEDLSPMPPTSQPPVRRRGAFSAEPVSEEDATSYVKKVN